MMLGGHLYITAQQVRLDFLGKARPVSFAQQLQIRHKMLTLRC